MLEYTARGRLSISKSFFDWRDMAKARESSALSDDETAKAGELTALIELAVAGFYAGHEHR